MSGLDKNRKRNQTVSFRVSPNERRKMEARIQISGLPKGEYMVRCLLDGEIVISVGKYQSDRLGLELKRWREYFERSGADLEIMEDCKVLLDELLSLMQKEITDETMER